MPPQISVLMEPSFATNPSMTKTVISKRDALVKKNGTEVALMDWGYPSYLTNKEFDIFVSCFKILQKYCRYHQGI